MKYHILFLITLLVSAAASTALHAREIILASGEYPPYTSHKENARFIDELIQKAYQEVGIKVNYRYYPWKRSYTLAVEGRTIAGTHPWHKTPERQKVFYYSDPIFDDTEVFFHRKNVDFDWTRLEDLQNYAVGGTRGYYYIDILRKKGIAVDIANSDELNFKKLLSGRITVFLHSRNVGYHQIHQLYPPAQANRFTHHPKPFSVDPFYLLISKNREDGPELIKEFNQGLQRIQENGVYDAIMEKIR